MADAWPTTNIVTTDMDAGSDNAGTARADIKLMADAVNDMMGQPPMGSGFVAETGTTHTHAVTENGKIVVCTNATNCTVTILAAATAAAQFANGFIAGGAGSITFTGTIAGLTNPVIKAGEGCILYTDGTNWEWHFFTAYHAPVANFVSGREHFIDDDVGVGSSSFDIDAVIGASWESVGPTGSSATNIFTGLNSVPLDASAVLVKIYNNASVFGTSINQWVAARKTGSSAAAATRTIIAHTAITVTGSGTTTLVGTTAAPYIAIPIDSSGRFDLYLNSPSTASTILHVIGWLG